MHVCKVKSSDIKFMFIQDAIYTILMLERLRDKTVNCSKIPLFTPIWSITFEGNEHKHCKIVKAENI